MGKPTRVNAPEEAAPAATAPEPGPTAWLRASVAVVTDAAALALLAPTLPTLTHRTVVAGGADDAVTALGALLATVAALLLLPGLAVSWLAVTGSLVGVRPRALERAAALLTPVVVRRVLAAGLGAGLGLGLMAPATAADVDLGWGATSATDPSEQTEPPPVDAATAATPAAPVPGSDVARTADVTGPAREPTPGTSVELLEPVADGPERSGQQDVVVEAGDTLWHIAARSLDDPTTAEIAAAWPRWWDANRDVLDDPDLIHPGQELRAPAPAVHVPSKEQP
ncbi:LysM peptidoglycan-binding domain-containing protein [Cellulomonas sp. APG4]|uniref:LysM peptidoglycan-binding domain-containing protein n=1 Tax=Cellulomonas sp. APG4 TaxID=1538656 RepID=UPI00137943A6|nr:LysM peptidoglycan-binding domain-containing protein [Cellulomonas sp. APG4]NCT91372.1 LysM peptidoglycan-binding domain-containing protein [Cellulomonas sp. APG4]